MSADSKRELLKNLRSSNINTIKPPNLFKLALEGRAFWEFGASIVGWPMLKRSPDGDQHPVIVYPGLVAGDFSTAPIRKYLRDLGYCVYGWDQGLNYGPREGVIETASAMLQKIADQHGQAVSLIGWSLGGIYARELAKLNPTIVRAVITMGSPFAGDPRSTNAWRLFKLVSPQVNTDGASQANLKFAPPAPTTSIYSRSDGIVPWECSVQRPQTGHLTENIEVHASHFGIGLNPLTWYAVADRLAQAAHQWQPFDRSGARGMFFKTPQL